jgi:hypothetical protein
MELLSLVVGFLSEALAALQGRWSAWVSAILVETWSGPCSGWPWPPRPPRRYRDLPPDLALSLSQHRSPYDLDTSTLAMLAAVTAVGMALAALRLEEEVPPLDAKV